MAWQKQKPLLVLFEGGEGSGKTTQTQLLYGKMKRIGRRVRYNDEPGATAIGFKIRTALLDAESGEMDPLTEFLLFEADRSLNFNFNVIPWLKEGIDVIQDRSFGSTFAYQGYGRGLIRTHGKLMRVVDKETRRGKYPDIIFLLDADPKKVIRRIRKATSFEKEPLKFHNLLRKGYLTQARADKKHWVVIDALQSPDIIHKQIWRRVSKLLGIKP